MSDRQIAITEDVILYFLYRRAKSQGSRCFFKLKHNMSPERGWYFFFGPDVDLLEITNDKVVIGYEAKGQRMLKGEPSWPALYEGLDEAMAYLELPYISKDGKRMFRGGGLDKVYLVHPISKIQDVDEIWKDIMKLTPIGYVGILPNSEVLKVVPAKPNPIHNVDAREFLINNIGSLEKFTEIGRTFRSIRSEGELYCSKMGLK
ncbi:MAG: hypothetical protein H3Z51_06860 [archaeon]|nr:hypothetical protein [archaeon]